MPKLEQFDVSDYLMETNYNLLPKINLATWLLCIKTRVHDKEQYVFKIIETIRNA